ncbi:MAG: sensor domain-containing diguanylate cyclase [Myxococcota bacterium]
MSEELQKLAALTRGLRAPLTLEQLLQSIANEAAALLDTPRASVRLLDPSGTRLMASVRAGEALHTDAFADFTLGQGLVGWVAQHGQPLRSGDAQAEPRFHHRPDLKDPLGSFVGVPMMAGRVCLGVLSAVHGERDHFTAHHEALLELLAAICSPHVEIARLARLAQVDPLTGALNRRGLDLVFPDTRTGPTSVVLVDVDHFKRINDQHGHAVGDEVLRRVAHLLSTVLRAGDSVARWGGEEFLLVLPGVELARAHRVAERARAILQKSPLLIGEQTIGMTASFGVAEQGGDETRDALIARADQAMYAAKQGGRNRVCAAPQPAPR